MEVEAEKGGGGRCWCLCCIYKKKHTTIVKVMTRLDSKVVGVAHL